MKDKKPDVRPLHDKVLLRLDEPDKQTPGGIHLPDNAQQKQGKGTVLAVGSGRETKDGTVLPFSVEVGQRVLYNHYAAHRVPDDDTLVLVSETDVLAVLG